MLFLVQWFSSDESDTSGDDKTITSEEETTSDSSNNNLLIYSALFNIPGDQKRITTINNLKLYKY